MEWCISFCGKYRIESLTPKTFPGAMKVLKDAYVQDEYVSIANEVNTHPQATEEFLYFCADVALDGASVVAVEIETEEVVAACFNKLHTGDVVKEYSDFLEQATDLHPATRSLTEFGINLAKRVDIAKLYEAECCFELLFLATIEQHRGKKLGYLCCKASVDVAKKLKDGPVSTITVQDLGKYSTTEPREVTKLPPKVCHITCTSVATHKIAKALDFTQHLRVSFTEFSYNGLNYVERNGYDPYCEVSALRL